MLLPPLGGKSDSLRPDLSQQEQQAPPSASAFGMSTSVVMSEFRQQVERAEVVCPWRIEKKRWVTPLKTIEEYLPPPTRSETRTALQSVMKLTNCHTKLGNGWNGTVGIWKNRARHRCAVKILGLKKKRDWQTLFKGEINALLVNDQHPNIVKTHSILLFNKETGEFRKIRSMRNLAGIVKEDYEVEAIVCEKIEGHNLAQILEVPCDNTTCDYSYSPNAYLAISLGSQIASALLHLHKANILLRDLKPDNIMVTDLFEQVKLIDFGLSEVLQPGAKATKGWGTTDYMAPEVITTGYRKKEGPGYYDKRADVWSLGVLLLEIATGDVPGGFTSEGVSYPQEDLKHATMDNILWFASMSFDQKKTYLCQHFSKTFENTAPLLDLILRLLDSNPESRMSIEEASQTLNDLNAELDRAQEVDPDQEPDFQ